MDPLVCGSQSKLAVPIVAPTEHLALAGQSKDMWSTPKGKLTRLLLAQPFNLAWLQPTASVCHSYCTNGGGIKGLTLTHSARHGVQKGRPLL